MQRSLEHESPQFTVNATFESFSALKHTAVRAALLNCYEFDPVKVDSGWYTIKCKDKECSWCLHVTSVGETDTWKIRTSIQKHTCHRITHDGYCNVDVVFISIEILPKVCSNLSIKPKASRTISKTLIVSKSTTKKPGEPENGLLNLSMVHTVVVKAGVRAGCILWLKSIKCIARHLRSFKQFYLSNHLPISNIHFAE